MSFLSLLSDALGWSYFLLWSASFWPQTLLLLRRRNLAGLSPDFVLLNTLGFACYSAATLALYGSSAVREAYEKRHGELPSTHVNDVAFAVHGLVLCIAQALMALFFPKAPGQSVAQWAWGVFGLLSVVLAAATGVAAAGSRAWSWLDVVWVCSSIKLAITILKWLPQIAMNHKRRSTRGFAVTNVVLDLGGGVLSLAQLAVDAKIVGSWRAVIGDPGKIGLSLLTLLFDVIIMWQHYVLFGPAIVPAEGALNYARGEQPDEEASRDEQRPLLGTAA